MHKMHRRTRKVTSRKKWREMGRTFIEKTQVYKPSI